jgi:hypothetical protein
MSLRQRTKVIDPSKTPLLSKDFAAAMVTAVAAHELI